MLDCNSYCLNNDKNNLENERLLELYSYEMLYTSREECIDSITKLTSIICQTPICLVSLVDKNKQWFKSKLGLEVDETDRDISFCRHAIQHDYIFEVKDSLKDERFVNNPLVTGYPFIRYYAGMPLKSPNGFNLGTLCVIDTKPHELKPEQKLALETLAKQVILQFEMKKLLKELKIANEKSLKLSQVKDEFLSNMSHELRTPLNAIYGFTEILQNSIKDQKLKEYLDIIKSSVEILISLINDILDFSKIESGKLVIEKEPFNFRKATKEIFELLKQKALEKDLKLSFNISRKIPKILIGDKIRLNQILVNLIGNAIKFTNKGKVEVTVNRIRLKIKSLSDDNLIKAFNIDKIQEGQDAKNIALLEFIVRDTGIGIKEDKLNVIFERFEQASSDITRKYGGSGLGLSISKNLVQLQNGEIKVKSTLGVGSEFSFLIPYEFTEDDVGNNKILFLKKSDSCDENIEFHCFPLEEEIKFKTNKDLLKNNNTKEEATKNMPKPKLSKNFKLDINNKPPEDAKNYKKIVHKIESKKSIEKNSNKTLLKNVDDKEFEKSVVFNDYDKSCIFETKTVDLEDNNKVLKRQSLTSVVSCSNQRKTCTENINKAKTFEQEVSQNDENKESLKCPNNSSKIIEIKVNESDDSASFGEKSNKKIFLETEEKIIKAQIAKNNKSSSAYSNNLDPKNKINILLCEDNNFNVKLIEKILFDSCYRKCINLDTAYNGKIGVEMIKHNPNKYDLILMDLQMPEMNGLESSWYIRNELKLNIPIIAMTANICPDERKRCKETGINEYFTKPFNKKEFFECFKVMLQAKLSNSFGTETQRKTVASPKNAEKHQDSNSTENNYKKCYVKKVSLSQQSKNNYLAFRDMKIAYQNKINNYNLQLGENFKYNIKNFIDHSTRKIKSQLKENNTEKNYFYNLNSSNYLNYDLFNVKQNGSKIIFLNKEYFPNDSPNLNYYVKNVKEPILSINKSNFNILNTNKIKYLRKNFSLKNNLRNTINFKTRENLNLGNDNNKENILKDHNTKTKPSQNIENKISSNYGGSNKEGENSKVKANKNATTTTIPKIPISNIMYKSNINMNKINESKRNTSINFFSNNINKALTEREDNSNNTSNKPRTLLKFYDNMKNNFNININNVPKTNEKLMNMSSTHFRNISHHTQKIPKYIEGFSNSNTSENILFHQEHSNNILEIKLNPDSKEVSSPEIKEIQNKKPTNSLFHKSNTLNLNKTKNSTIKAEENKPLNNLSKEILSEKMLINSEKNSPYLNRGNELKKLLDKSQSKYLLKPVVNNISYLKIETLPSIHIIANKDAIIKNTNGINNFSGTTNFNHKNNNNQYNINNIFNFNISNTEKIFNILDEESSKMEMEKINHEVLDDYSDGDIDSKKELIISFLNEFPPLMEELGKFIKKTDFKEISSICHKMKSPVNFFGLKNFKDKIIKVEDFSKVILKSIVRLDEYYNKMKEQSNYTYDELKKIIS